MHGVECKQAAFTDDHQVRRCVSLRLCSEVAHDLVHNLARLTEGAVQPFEQKRGKGDAAAGIRIWSHAFLSYQVPILEAVKCTSGENLMIGIGLAGLILIAIIDVSPLISFLLFRPGQHDRSSKEQPLW